LVDSRPEGGVKVMVEVKVEVKVELMVEVEAIGR